MLCPGHRAGLKRGLPRAQAGKEGDLTVAGRASSKEPLCQRRAPPSELEGRLFSTQRHWVSTRRWASPSPAPQAVCSRPRGPQASSLN